MTSFGPVRLGVLLTQQFLDEQKLLDIYTAERRPVAEAVLANTRAQVTFMRLDP